MNLLGKVLVMVIFIESLAFMFFSVSVYSTHKNWRDEVNVRLRPELQQQQQTNRTLQTRLTTLQDELEQERTARQQALASLETNTELHRQEVAGLQSDVERLQGENRDAVATMAANEQTLESLRDETTRLREQIRGVQAEKDESFAQMVALTDELNERQNDLKLLQTRNMMLLERVARMGTVLERHSLDEHEPVDGLPPRVNGVILALGARGLVEISIGSDDGLRKGHMLEVFRLGDSTSKYLGRVEVLNTEPDRAVAKIIPEFRKATFQKEDRVATRLD